MIDFVLLDELNKKMIEENLALKHTSHYNKKYTNLVQKLVYTYKEYNREWMKIYEPSINGFETLIHYMISKDKSHYILDDPVNNGFQPYYTFLANWLYHELIKYDHEIEKKSIITTFKSLSTDMKDILKKYNVKDITINVTKDKDYRQGSKIGSDRYIAKVNLFL